MSIKMSTIAQIQKAGQAVHDASLSLGRDAQAANESLQKALQQAMQSKRDDAQTERIFTQWKTLARVAQEVAQMEVALRELYVACTALSSGKEVAPPSAGKKGKAATSPAPVADAKAMQKPKRKVGRPRKVDVPGVPREGNEQKLMEYFGAILSTTELKPVHHMDIKKATGIPSGSIAATIKRLANKNLLETGRRGALRLIAPPASQVPPAAEPPVAA